MAPAGAAVAWSEPEPAAVWWEKGSESRGPRKTNREPSFCGRMAPSLGVDHAQIRIAIAGSARAVDRSDVALLRIWAPDGRSVVAILSDA